MSPLAAASHDKALDLAADRLDFELDDSDEAFLNYHLASCADCERYAEMMAKDDGLLETFSWEDEEAGGGESDEFSPDPDPDGPPDPNGPPRGPEMSDEDEADNGHELDDDGDHEAKASSDDEDDDSDHTPLGSTPLGTADDDDGDIAPSGQTVETDEHDDLTPQSAGDGDVESDGNPASGPSSGYDREDDEAAEAVADSMSDQDLADVDSDAQADDGVFPECVADGVEEVAEANGASAGKDAHRRAERAVRAQDGIESTQYGKVAVYKTTRGFRLHKGQNGDPMVSATAAAAIRNAIMRSRTGHTGVARHQARGRLDSRGLHRIAMADHRLFKRTSAPDPGRFLVWVMVDVSGSMSGSPIADAATVARALADASSGTPTVRLAVWGWSDPFLYEQARYGGASAGVAKVWETGQPVNNVFKLTELSMGGTPDSAVLEWSWRSIQREAHSTEQPVVIMCSDGWGDRSLPVVIERATKHGVAVKSVALGDYVHEADQLERFGKGNYVPWRGSIEETARPLATMIARMAAGL